MREIVLDTETTGFEPEDGHRIVEIGCIEVINQIPTGRVFHRYVNPDRAMPDEAYKVHGLSEEFLADKPRFAEIADDFSAFIGEDPLVIHNAAFDMRFINHEFGLCGLAALPMTRAVDTLAMARQKFPGSPASLDALCKRFEVDNSDRTFHGALLDSELLAEVYLHLLGGRQHGLGLGGNDSGLRDSAVLSRIVTQTRPYRVFDLSEDELCAHQRMLDDLTDPLWRGVGQGRPR